MSAYGVESYMKYSIIPSLLNVSVLLEPFTAVSGKRAGRSMENLRGNMLGRVQASAQSKTMKKRVSIVCGTPYREGASVRIMDYVQQKERVACNQVPQDC
jgi:hypothetical protein